MPGRDPPAARRPGAPEEPVRRRNEATGNTAGETAGARRAWSHDRRQGSHRDPGAFRCVPQLGLAPPGLIGRETGRRSRGPERGVRPSRSCGPECQPSGETRERCAVSREVPAYAPVLRRRPSRSAARREIEADTPRDERFRNRRFPVCPGRVRRSRSLAQEGVTATSLPERRLWHSCRLWSGEA